MVKFNQLSITPDGRHMIIDCQVNPHKYFENVYLDEIIIDSHDTYTQGGPSKKPCIVKKFMPWNEIKDPPMFCRIKEEDSSEEETQDTQETQDSQETQESGIPEINIKHGRIILDWQDFVVPLHNFIFFVYVKTKGTPDPKVPCGMDSMFTLGVTVNLYPVYESMLCTFRELNNKCDIPKNVIDMFLRYEAFEVNVKTGHYLEAIQIWCKWFMKFGRKPIPRGMKADIYPNHAYTHGRYPLAHIPMHWHHPRRRWVKDYQAHNERINHDDISHHMPFPTFEFFGGPFNYGGFFPVQPIGGCNCGH